MAPKEKAIELVYRFEWDLAALQSDGAIHSQQAKKDALEVIGETVDSDNVDVFNLQYWQQVKEEINKL